MSCRSATGSSASPEVLSRDRQQDVLGLEQLFPSSMVFLGKAVAMKSSLEQFFCCLFSVLPPGRERLGQPLAVVPCERRAESRAGPFPSRAGCG